MVRVIDTRQPDLPTQRTSIDASTGLLPVFCTLADRTRSDSVFSVADVVFDVLWLIPAAWGPIRCDASTSGLRVVRLID
jgi:hypothetical protein